MENVDQVTSQKQEMLSDVIMQLKECIGRLLNIREDFYKIKVTELESKLNKPLNNIGGRSLLLVVGEFGSGKSTFLNALLGADILPTARNPCTSIIAEIEIMSDGYGHRGNIHFMDKSISEYCTFEDFQRIIDGRTKEIGKLAKVHHAKLFYDVQSLSSFNLADEHSSLRMIMMAKLILVDSPGFNSPYGVNEEVIRDYIEKSTYTFWFSPSDHIGESALARRVFQQLKKKRREIMPIISKSGNVRCFE